MGHGFTGLHGLVFLGFSRIDGFNSRKEIIPTGDLKIKNNLGIQELKNLGIKPSVYLPAC